MLNKIKIGPKLIGCFTIVACLSVVVGIIGISGMTQMSKADGRLYEKVTAPMKEFVDLSSCFQQVNIVLRDMLRSKSPSFINGKVAEVNELLAKGQKSVEAIDKTILTNEGRKVMAEFQEVRQPFKENLNQIISIRFRAASRKSATSLPKSPRLLMSSPRESTRSIPPWLKWTR
jgi:methyl-accepting chemotaxis protein